MKETKFKNTEIGRIPEDWEVTPIGKACNVRRGVRVTKEQLTDEGRYPVYQNTNYPMGYFDNYNADANTPFVIVGGSAGQIGLSKERYWAADDCAYFEKSNTLNKFFLYYELTHRQFEIKKFVRTASVPRLDRKVIEDFVLPLPSLHEQHRIASALTSIDNLISSLGKLIEKKKNIKQGTMQQLLTGQIRLKGFSEPWGEKKLEEVCSVKRGVRVVKRNLTTDGLYPVYQNTNFPLGYSNQYNVEANTPFVIIGGSAGQMGICRERYWAADDCAFFACHDIYKEYLYYVLLLNQSNILHNVRTGTIPRLDRSFLSNMVVYISSNIDEQQAIATILTKMDDEITALEAKRAKYEAIKQGMMQQLLTGKIRLIS